MTFRPAEGTISGVCPETLPEPHAAAPSTKPLEDALGDLQRALHEPFATVTVGAVDNWQRLDIELRHALGTRLHELHQKLPPLLLTDPRFGQRGELMIASASGSMSIYPNDALGAITRQLWRSGSVSKTIAWLEKILCAESASGTMVSMLHGVRVGAAVELTPEVRLVPLGDVPDSYNLRRFIGNQLHEHGLWQPTTCALVTRRTIAPLIWRVGGDVAPANNPDYIRLHDLHRDAALALTAVGPSLSQIVEQWFTFDDSDVQLAAWPDGQRSWPMREIRTGPRQQEDIVELDGALAEETVRRFIALEDRPKDLLRLGLQRLNQAQARQAVGDAAVELFTALESLLGDGQTNELLHKMSTRAVRLIGGEPPERDQNFSILKKFYEVRSQLVHTGKVSAQEFKVNGARIPVEDLARRAIIICARVLRVLIERGSIPDWRAFDIA